MNKFKVRITMLSDWHVGSGAGIPGNIDAMIARDSDGFPFIPAKTLVGIWRDAMERLIYGLDNGNDIGFWSQWVNVIFGSQPAVVKNPNDKPLPAILAPQPARLPEGLRNAINKDKNDPRLKQALTFIKPENKMDELSGTTATKMLRLVEMGRIGSILESDCELDLSGLINDEPPLIDALLIASAKLVERIGGKRRRGSGKCSFDLIDCGMDLKQAINYLQTPAIDITKLPKQNGKKGDLTFADSSSDSTWKKIKYTLKLKTPVAIVTATLGNVSETLDFIPGTYLLPYITKGKNLFASIANGDIQVSPATIEVDGKRGMPVPKVIYKDKDDGGFDKEKGSKPTVYNLFQEPELINNDVQKKNYRDGYVSTLDAIQKNGTTKLPLHKIPSKTLSMHNTVFDDKQRPTDAGIYSREAIAAGTVLHGEIRFKSALESNITGLSKTEIRIGTSKKDDYGLAEIEFQATPESVSSVIPLNNSHLVVYLASDVLIRNQQLRQSNSIVDLKDELEKTLGTGALEILLSDETITNSLIQTRRIDSWQVSWGLPRPTLIAMSAGSCVKFEINGFSTMSDDTKTELTNKLHQLDNSGIGERRGEGYGQIRFNPKLLTEKINKWSVDKRDLEKEKATNPTNSSAPKAIESEMEEFAKQIETIAWREELQKAVLQIADDPNKRKNLFGFEIDGKKSIPSLSQIGGLRSVISRLNNDGSNKQIVSDWLSHLKATNNRIAKWKSFDILEAIFLEGIIEKLWENLVLNEPPILVPAGVNLKGQLWGEAARTLFDACMRAHKRDGGLN